LFVYILKLSFFTKPNNVILNLLARSIARLVGAPTPAIRPILDISPFWINSKFNLPEHAINWEWLSIIFFLCEWPISLSKALCLPTSSLETVEVIKENKLDISYPKIQKEIILKSPELLTSEQSEFSKTGGIHASSLIDESGKVIATREDVGRHNALDKLIGHSHKKKIIDNHSQFIACSGRLNFELIQKGLMSNIGIMAGVGAPTSLAIDLAKRFNMTLLGFVKKNSFNIYTNKERVLF